MKLTTIGNQIFSVTDVEYKYDNIVAIVKFIKQKYNLKFELINNIVVDGT
ncbi:hypothetical protein EHE19_018185 [Ruminiclostridium herbifermentans]|uniref:Uncharacterized protein n=1 Tax=Ruminiclostridium herbifermentans TaxID=2488810 RepID=A0A7H1VMY0_9FIRM|nr:hypothetical protein EHE19_018185 [Ruminiclostridium herbifermentans]